MVLSGMLFGSVSALPTFTKPQDLRLSVVVFFNSHHIKTFFSLLSFLITINAS